MAAKFSIKFPGVGTTTISIFEKMETIPQNQTHFRKLKSRNSLNSEISSYMGFANRNGIFTDLNNL